MNKRSGILCMALGTTGLLALACGGGAVPTKEVADARAAVAAADTAGAARQPQASVHLKLANDQIQRAMELIEQDEVSEARRALERARVDANLAEQLARAGQERAKVQEAQERLRQLTEETGGIEP